MDDTNILHIYSIPQGNINYTYNQTNSMDDTNIIKIFTLLSQAQVLPSQEIVSSSL